MNDNTRIQEWGAQALIRLLWREPDKGTQVQSLEKGKVKLGRLSLQGIVGETGFQ
jgi:hypothetical protein